MKQYFNHIKLQEPHVRRKHALRIAGAITGLFALAWLVTLPARLNTDTVAAKATASDQVAAAAAAAQYNPAQLEVASTTLYNY
ncbi:MAG: hypothetical protein V4474_01010 [Patescibacteria group bacterium]